MLTRARHGMVLDIGMRRLGPPTNSVALLCAELPFRSPVIVGRRKRNPHADLHHMEIRSNVQCYIECHLQFPVLPIAPLQAIVGSF